MTAIQGTDSKYLRLARDVGPLLNAEAESSIQQGALSELTVKTILDSGFVSMATAKQFGGSEIGYVQLIAVLEELSRADGAVGWCLQAISSSAAAYTAMIPPAGAAAIFATTDQPRIVGMPAPRGRAEKVPGGYLFTGRHQFASGADWSTHFVAGAVVYDGDERVLADNGFPLSIAVVVPRDQVVEKGNWDVNGLEATSSIDYDVGPRFVSDDFVFTTNPWPTVLHHGARHWTLGFEVLGGIGHTPVALGLARRALEEIAALAPHRKRVDAAYPPVSEQPLFLHDFALLESELNGVRLAFYDLLARCERHALDHGTQAPPLLAAHVKQTVRHAHDVAVRCVDFALNWSGSAGLRRGHAIGRVFRNVRAMNQHIMVDRHLLIDPTPLILDELALGAADFAASAPR